MSTGSASRSPTASPSGNPAFSLRRCSLFSAGFFCQSARGIGSACRSTRGSAMIWLSRDWVAGMATSLGSGSGACEVTSTR
jgi:hypothetical protein